MHKLEIQDGVIQVDANIIVRDLGLGAFEVQSLMREGKLTSSCERSMQTKAPPSSKMDGSEHSATGLSVMRREGSLCEIDECLDRARCFARAVHEHKVGHSVHVRQRPILDTR